MLNTKPQPDVDSSIDQGEVKQAKEVVQSLIKTLKAYKMYLPNNPIHQKFSTELLQKLFTFLWEQGELSLQVTKSEFLYKGQIVYSDTEKEMNLVFRLCADGINSLTIHDGLVKEEFFEFLDILTKGLNPNNFDDDLVTLLWAKGFEHIKYVATDEFLQTEGLEKQIAEVKGQGTPVGGDFKEAYEEAMSKGADAEGIQRTSNPGSLSVFTLSREDIEELKKELGLGGNSVENTSVKNTIAAVIEILFEILYSEGNIEAFSEMAMYLEKGTESLLRRGDLSSVNKIMDGLREMLGKKEIFSENQIFRIQKAIEKMGSEENIRNLKGVLNSGEIKDAEGLYYYISHLDKRSIPNLCELLDANDMQNRRVVCDALAELSKGDVELLAKKLGDKNWFITRNIIYVLGKTGNKGAVEYLKRTLDNPEARVRKETVRALGRIGTEKAKELLVSVLGDEDSQNRILAARNLASLGYKRALEPLLKIINRADFSEKESAEKRAIMEAYGRIGQDEAIPFLGDTLKKKGWFGKAKKDEMRSCAAYALGAIGSKEAKELLISETSSKDEVVKEACKMALASIGRVTKEEDQLMED